MPQGEGDVKITLELLSGPNGNDRPTKREIQKNIDALQRSIDGKPQVRDHLLLSDTMSILAGIQKQLPDR
jgi:hypothetical protein